MNTKIESGTYVLSVKNLDESFRFYKDKMGFQLIWEAAGWKCVGRDSIKIMLGECPDDMAAGETGCHSYFAYFQVSNIDELYREYQNKNIVLRTIEDKPWYMREFTIRTADGHVISIGQPINKKKDADF